MQAKIQELIKDLPSLDSHEVVLVGMDGCGGAGKSTVAETLANELGISQIIHVDDFYKPKDQRIEIT